MEQKEEKGELMTPQERMDMILKRSSYQGCRCQFSVHGDNRASIQVFDLQGRLIADEDYYYSMGRITVPYWME